MRIHLLAVGDKMPGWVQAAYQDYAQRLPSSCALELKPISPGHRGKNADLSRFIL